MGDAQSAPREARSDAVEESGEVKDVETGQDINNKVLKNNGQISDINKKAESSKVELNGHCDDEIAIEAAICPDIDASDLLKEETTLENDQMNLPEVTEETLDEQIGHNDVIEMDAKQNDINESFKKFFSNIGLKLTVKRGSTDKGAVPVDVAMDGPSKPKDIKVEDTATETIGDAQENTDLNTAEEAVENDSTVCQALTDVTPDDFQEQEEEQTAETKEQITSHDAGISSPLSEGATQQEDPCPASPASLDETASPFKKFFTTGIFSGLRKKKKLEDDEVGEKALVEGGEKLTQAAHDQQHDEGVTPGVDAAKTENEFHEEKTKKENLIAKSAKAQDEAKAPSIVVNEITNSQEIVQESPLKRLLSGSSLKKLSKKQKDRKSSDANLSDSGEHISDQLLSSAESAENKKVEPPAQTSAEALSGEDGAWFSFKKLVTPQKKKKGSVDHEERQIPSSRDGAKSSEGEQISDHSIEEGKRRKDSSVSWEAVLCGSGRRRSRKTSDSEDEIPHIDSEDNKQNGGSKEAPPGTSNEMQEILASSPKQTGSPPEGDEGSTWRSFKKLVTPKRKVKDEEESNSEEDSAFSIKRLLSGRKTRKSLDVSADEVSKEASICDEDSDTPAVVPLSEFDLPETQTDAEKESYIVKEADSKPQIDIKIKQEVQVQDTVPIETIEIPVNEGASEKEASSAAATTNEDELTDSSMHQQLSDIPEEGVLTENTPASYAEEAAKDETIAEDLLEITSEAITAPEPADVTLEDETEMVSAVSQLIDSSKTSGNTTPVPIEYNVMNTESFLQQVSETISVSLKAVPVCLEELSPERVVCSVSHQILQSSELDHPKILEIHRGSDATSIKTGLNTEGIDALNNVAATAQAESISHLNEAISTEIASEIPKEELDTAESAAGEVCEVNVSGLQKDIKDLQITAKNQHVVEDAGDVDIEVVSTESLPKGEEAAEILTNQAENCIRKTHSEEELVVTSAADAEEPSGKEVHQNMTEEDIETKEKAFEQTQNEAQPPATVVELEELVGAEIAELTNEECNIQSHEEGSPENIQLTEILSQDLTEVTKENKEPQIVEAKLDQSPEKEAKEDMVQTLNTEVSVSENISTGEMDTDEPKPVESLPVSEEAEKKEPPNYQSKVREELESFHPPTLEDAAQSFNKEEQLSDDPAAETDEEESKQVESLTEVTDEVERKEPQIAAAQTDGSEVTEVLEIVQAPTSESEENAVHSFHKVSLPDFSPAEKHTEESKPLESLTEDEQEHKEPEMDETQIYQPEVTEGFEGVQAQTLESQKDVLLSLNKEVSLSDISPAETEAFKQVASLCEVTDQQVDKETKTDAAQTDNAEPIEELKSLETPTVKSEDEVVQSITKDTETDIQSDKSEDKEPQTDAAQSDHVEKLIRAQAPIFHSEKDAFQAVFSENISSAVTNIEEPEMVTFLSEVHEEQDDKGSQTKIHTLASSEVTQASEVKESINVVQEAILESEGSRVEVLEKDVTPHVTVPKAETVEEKPRDIQECLTQGIVKAKDAPETEYAQESEAAVAPSLDQEAISSEACDVEVISYDTPAEEMITEELIMTESKEPPSVKLEGLPPNTHDITSDVETCQPTTAPSDEESKTQELEQQTLLQDVPQPEDIDIVTEEPERKPERQLDQDTDSKRRDAKVGHEENVLKDLEGLQALTAVHISSVNEDPRRVLEKTTCLEETQPDMDEVSEESKNKGDLSEQQEKVEEEKTGLLLHAEIKVASTNYNIISHEVMSNLEHVSTEKLNVMVREDLMGKMASETEFIDTVETTTQLVPDEINQVAEPSIAVVTMRVPSVEIEVNHKVQVHVMDVDIRSAKNAVDTVIQVGVTEDKEVIDVCHESIQEVENLSATAGIEGETTNEEIQVTVQDVMQHVTSNLPETPSKLATEYVEQVIKQSETMTEVCETDQKESVETEDGKVINVGSEAVIERPGEEAAVIIENSGITAEQEGLEEPKVPCIIPQSSDVSLKDHKEDLEEVKDEELEVCTAARDVSAEELAGKGPKESTMEPLPCTQGQIATPGNARLAVPQSTGVISSVGNLESPSSLSLEFKLNIQFAQAKAPTWPSAVPTERTEAVKHADVSEAGVHTEESVRQRDECKKQTELNEVAMQATSITEPDATSHLIQRAVIASQPVLQDVGIQAVETTDMVEQTQSTERAIPKVQAVEVFQSARQEKRTVLVSKPLLSEVKKGWAFRQSEEENDQDVWLDAEEDIYAQQETQTSRDKVDEHVKLQSESEQKDEAEPELEFEMACSLETEDTESQRDVLKKKTCEIESEGEDFTVALEDLVTSVSAME